MVGTLIKVEAQNQPDQQEPGQLEPEPIRCQRMRGPALLQCLQRGFQVPVRITPLNLGTLFRPIISFQEPGLDNRILRGAFSEFFV